MHMPEGSSMFKAIFIDIDNTLLDFDGFVRSAMKTGFEKFGLAEYEPRMYDTFTRINSGLWKRLELGELDFEYIQKNRWNEVFEELKIDFSGPEFEAYFRSFLWDCAIPIDGAYELLEALQGLKKEYTQQLLPRIKSSEPARAEGGLKKEYTQPPQLFPLVCAASNGPNAQQLHRLEKAGMTKYFDYIFISEAVGASKPDKAFFDFAFETINNAVSAQAFPPVSGQSEAVLIRPEDCLIIGDSMSSDMEGGFRCGMKTLYFDKHAGEAAVPDNAGHPVTGPAGRCPSGGRVPDAGAGSLRDIPGLIREFRDV